MCWLILLAVITSLASENDEAMIAQHAKAAADAMQAGDYAAAEQQDRLILRLRPRMAEAEVNLGLSCFLQRKYPEAVRTLAAALRLNPGLENARLFLGMSYFELNQISVAISTLQRYVAAVPGDLQGRYYLGLSYLSAEKFAEAQSTLTAAREIDPVNVNVLYHLAQAYLGDARLHPSRREAIAPLFDQTLQEITASNPKSFRLAQLRAGLDELDGNKAEAIRELESIFEADPKVRGLHYTLGCLYIEQREYEKARSQLELELQLDAPYPRSYLQLGHVYVETGKPAQGVTLLEKALTADPENDGQVWLDLGRAYRLMDKPGQAAAAFEKAIARGQANSSVYYQLAMVTKKLGDVGRSHEAMLISQRLRGEEQQRHVASASK